MDKHVFLHRNIYFTVNQVTIIQNVSSKTKSVSVDIRQQKRNISRHFILFFFHQFEKQGTLRRRVASVQMSAILNTFHTSYVNERMLDIYVLTTCEQKTYYEIRQKQLYLVVWSRPEMTVLDTPLRLTQNNSQQCQL